MKKVSLLLSILALMLCASGESQVTLVVDAGASKHQISRHIYGHFSEHLGRCIYDGYWVDPAMQVPKQDRIRLDIVDALKKIKIPNLRWPGGCFADEYHWRDGMGPREQRPTMINTNWGNTRSGKMELSKGADPYISHDHRYKHFDNPSNVRITGYDGAGKKGNLLIAVIPAKSIVLLKIK